MHHFQGHYNEKSWKKIESLTEEEILDTINHKNVSGIFLKDFNFKELLGDIKYDEHGRIIGELIIIVLTLFSLTSSSDKQPTNILFFSFSQHVSTVWP